MYWSRKFKTSKCGTNTRCNYIGIARNDKRHAENYHLIAGCDPNKIRINKRVQNNKEEMASLTKQGVFNDTYKNRNLVDNNCTRSLMYLYRRNQPNNRGSHAEILNIIIHIINF